MNTKNIMLYGAPGVGKTHNYKRLITMIEDNKSQHLDLVANEEACQYLIFGEDFCSPLKKSDPEGNCKSIITEEIK